MKTKTFSIFMALMFAIGMVMLMLLPDVREVVGKAGSAFLKFLGNVSFLVFLFGWGPITGFLMKAFAIDLLDRKVEPKTEFTIGQHWIWAFLLAIIFGVAKSLLMVWLMSFDTWISSIAMGSPFSWSGEYSSPPTFWIFTTFIMFTWLYMRTNYWSQPNYNSSRYRSR